MMDKRSMFLWILIIVLYMFDFTTTVYAIEFKGAQELNVFVADLFYSHDYLRVMQFMALSLLALFGSNTLANMFSNKLPKSLFFKDGLLYMIIVGSTINLIGTMVIIGS